MEVGTFGHQQHILFCQTATGGVPCRAFKIKRLQIGVRKRQKFATYGALEVNLRGSALKKTVDFDDHFAGLRNPADLFELQFLVHAIVVNDGAPVQKTQAVAYLTWLEQQRALGLGFPPDFALKQSPVRFADGSDVLYLTAQMRQSNGEVVARFGIWGMRLKE